MTREERREAEYKEGLKRFLVKASGGVAGIAVVLYLLVSWMFSESLPDLEYVSGVVTVNDAPVPGAEVVFAPMKALNKDEELESSAPSSGYTNAEGKFVLMYTPEAEGAIPAVHKVSIRSSAGMTIRMPLGTEEKSVKPGEDNNFIFNL